ncbi:MAG: hypothetical protein ACREUY_08945 [Burkholderiales bacterium]
MRNKKRKKNPTKSGAAKVLIRIGTSGPWHLAGWHARVAGAIATAKFFGRSGFYAKVIQP